MIGVDSIASRSERALIKRFVLPPEKTQTALAHVADDEKKIQRSVLDERF